MIGIAKDYGKGALRVLLAGLLMTGPGVDAIAAGDTEVMVRLRAADAKFIGSGVGGVNVTVQNAATGEVLDSGRITGGTGDTDKLMKHGQRRGYSPAGPDTAGFEAELDIEHPTRVRVALNGPLAAAQRIPETSVTTWVIPGEDMTDPGLVLRLPGLLVDLADREATQGSVQVTADVAMMCGCPITEDGLWPADDFEVVARLMRDGETVAEEELDATGSASRFAGTLEPSEPGNYRLMIHAVQKDTANVGVYESGLTLQ